MASTGKPPLVQMLPPLLLFLEKKGLAQSVAAQVLAELRVDLGEGDEVGIPDTPLRSSLTGCHQLQSEELLTTFPPAIRLM